MKMEQKDAEGAEKGKDFGGGKAVLARCWQKNKPVFTQIYSDLLRCGRMARSRKLGPG